MSSNFLRIYLIARCFIFKRSLHKKLDALDRDIDNFQNNIGELAALCRSLTERGHYDSENIKTQQVIALNCVKNKKNEFVVGFVR